MLLYRSNSPSKQDLEDVLGKIFPCSRPAMQPVLSLVCSQTRCFFRSKVLCMISQDRRSFFLSLAALLNRRLAAINGFGRVFPLRSSEVTIFAAAKDAPKDAVS